MKNHKLHRFGTVLVLTGLLICLLSISAFAGSKAEWGYQNLDTNQRKVYDALEAVVVADGNRVELDSSWGYVIDNTAPLNEVVRMFVADHPEYYWFTGSISYSYYKAPGSALDRVVAAIVPTYTHNTDQERALFEEEVTKLLAKIPAGANDYEKALYIHDVLVDHIVYDIDWQHEQSAYSAIVNGRAVCAGYARAYQYLLNRVGIDAWTVEGFGWNSQKGSLEAHAWNLVWIDGKCVYTDVTWDDQGDPIYAYFNRSLEVISRDHMTDSDTDPLWVDYFGDDLPKSCDHDDETYFVMNGINKIPEVSIETLATNVKGEDGKYVIHVLLNESFDFDEFSAWFDNDRRNNLIDAIGVYRYGSFSIGYSYMGDELRIVIEPSNYSTPSPDLIGYIGSTSNGKLTAYTNYAGTTLVKDRTYETVMVGYYSDEGELQKVAFAEMYLDEHGRGTIKADCPNAFDYCRIFVVGSEANPAPLCELLQLAAPQ